MKRVVFVLMCVCLAGSMTSFADIIVHEDDYNDHSPGDPFTEGSAWNWGDGACTHTATHEDYNDNIVVQHLGDIDNTGGTGPEDTRFGSKWDITMTGNTSLDPNDYTISFDLRNVQGDWDPHPLELFVLTANPSVGGARYGHGYPTLDLAQDDWVHVEFNLADYTKNWWEGTDWDLTNPTWAIEVGGSPWPGTPVPVGEAWTQIWLMDNLKITRLEQSTAFEPYPPNGMTDVPRDVVLKWAPGIFADKHDIYFDTNEAHVTDANRDVNYGILVMNHDTNSYYPPGDLLLDTRYFWRIDEVNLAGPDPCLWPGEVWSFTTSSVKAHDPSPPDEAPYVPFPEPDV